MNDALTIHMIVLLDDEIAIKWSDNTESYIKNDVLRRECPCAHCSGESDIFGNIYMGNKEDSNHMNQNKIINYVKIGHYAIRFFWADNHNAGIYPYDLLKKL